MEGSRGLVRVILDIGPWFIEVKVTGNKKQATAVHRQTQGCTHIMLKKMKQINLYIRDNTSSGGDECMKKLHA